MEKLLSELQSLLPSVNYEPGKAFCWSPETHTITYRDTDQPTVLDSWALLHEAGHALLDHKNYTSDLQLLLLEVAAWEKAQELSGRYGISINEDHIQDCMDTYRDWLYQRSLCPTCSTTSLQISASAYRCHNCTCEWLVTTSRFCRAYRKRSHKLLPDKSHQPRSGTKFI